jgi:P-type Ca2+ transporter type 2C
LNVFEGISRNWFFIGINIVTICGQVIIVSVGSSALSTVRLDMKQWGISLFLGALSLPIAVVIRLIPNDFIRKFLPRSWVESQTTYPELSSNDIRERFTFFKTGRGRRFDSLYRRGPPKLLLTTICDSTLDVPDGQMNGDASSHDCMVSDSALVPAIVMAGVVAGSIAGWSPIERVTNYDAELPSPRQRSSSEH